MNTATHLAPELDGLSIVQGMLTGVVAQAPIGETLDFRLVSAEKGSTVFEGIPSPQFTNPHSTMHGGWIATLLDSAMGCAVRTTLRPGFVYVTADLNVTFVKAVTSSVTKVRAEGRVLHAGGRLATAEGKLVGPDGTLYAHATTTCLVLPVPRSDGRSPKATANH